jgi:hypothetical protein
MADAAGVFPTTLLILYFITPPTHLPAGESKKDQEINATWTLQATNQIPTQDPIMCATLAKLMIAEFDSVNTTAIRTYCLCPHGNGSNLCFNEDEFQARIQDFTEGKKKVPSPGAAVQRIGPLTKVPSPFSAPNAGGATK